MHPLSPAASKKKPLFQLLALLAMLVAFPLLAIAAPEINVTGNGVSIPDGNATPSTADHTDFGSSLVTGGTVVRTFTIQNLGDSNLTLTGTPKVAVTGTHAGDFTLTAVPASPVTALGSTTFQVTFNPSSSGLRTATLTILNDDSDEGIYDFAIHGNGLLAPEINVTGNNVSIADGDVTPSTSDHTDFGSALVTGATVVRTFTIQNLGDASLTLSGTPKVLVSGTHAADFTVTALPTSPVTPGSSTTFQVTFDPSAGGTRTATLTIPNDDSDEATFAFSIRGAGVNNVPTATTFGTINSVSQAVVDRFVVGTNISGLTYAAEDHGYAATQFYTFLKATNGSSFFDTITASTGATVDRFDASTRTFDGLTYAAADLGYNPLRFYAISHDTAGVSTFSTVAPGGVTGVITDRFVLGTNFDAITFAADDVGFGANLFYYVRHDSTGLSTFGTITPGGTVTDRFTVGFNVDALVFTDLTAPGYGANNFYYLRHDASGESTFGTIFVTSLTTGTVTDRFTVGNYATELTFTATDAGSFGPNLFYFLRGRVTNVAPTLAAIANPAAILEDAALQTVSLSGIRAGGIESQALTVTATSSNTGLIPHPTVSYTSANAFGSLTYTPVANASGTAVITVVVTDDGGTDNGGINAVTNTFTVTVTAVNDAPTDITLTGGRVLDAAAIGSSAGTFTATDVDVGDTHTFSLVSGVGSTDNGHFTIVGNGLQLAVAAALADSAYSIRVRATDSLGATFDKVFTVLVMAVLVDAGDYLIADRGPQRNTGVVLAVTKVGSVQRIISTQLKDPYDIAVDAAGDYIVADYDYDPTGFGAGRGSSLFKIHRQTGVHTRLVFGAPLVTPLGVKVEADGKLLVADADFGYGPGATTAGAVFRIVPGASTNTLSSGNNFYFLQGLALATNGDIYVSNFGNGGGRPNRIIKVDKTTGAQTVITTDGLLTRPIGLAVESDGLSLVVVDAIAKKLIRVALPAGTQTQVSADAQFIQPTHVTIETDGSYVVTDGKASVTAGERRLYRVNGTTGVATILTSDGFFQQPRGVTIAQ